MRALLLLVALSGCGYGFGGPGPAVPSGARTVYVDLFANRTRSYGLEVRLRAAMLDEFRRHGLLKVVDERAGADVIVSGALRRVAVAPQATDAADEPLAYQTSILVSFRMTDRATGKVLADTPALSEDRPFAAVSSVVITSSPQFQQGTIDLRDLVDIPDAQLGEARRNDGLDDLIDQVARDIYLRTVEGF